MYNCFSLGNLKTARFFFVEALTYQVALTFTNMAMESYTLVFDRRISCLVYYCRIFAQLFVRLNFHLHTV